MNRHTERLGSYDRFPKSKLRTYFYGGADGFVNGLWLTPGFEKETCIADFLGNFNYANASFFFYESRLVNASYYHVESLLLI